MTPPRPITWILGAVCLAAITSWAVVSWTLEKQGWHRHDDEGRGGDFHEWLHRHLALSPEQERALAPVETAYQAVRTRLLQRVETGGKALASALDRPDPEGAAIEEALGEIQSAQGELQRTSIAHFLEMKKHLDEEQAERLLRWTRESIAHEPAR